MIFEVRQLANLPQSDQKGYEQSFDIYAPDGKWAGLVHCGNNDCPPHCKLPAILIQSRLVKAETAIGAYFKFSEWLEKGYDESFLLT